VIHVALVSAYPAEAQARAALADPANYAPEYARHAASDAPYLGVWRMPVPERTRVHVFADTTAEDLEAIGWTWEGA
jgi:hypothetical protein